MKKQECYTIRTISYQVLIIGDKMFSAFFDDLDSYAYRLGAPKLLSPIMLFLYPATWSIGVYRFGNWVTKKINVPIVRQLLFIVYFFFKRLTEILTGIEIAHNADIGRGLFIGHLGGVIIGHSSVIGKNASFHEGVTIGGGGRREKHGSPVIGNNVYFGAGAKVIGKIKVGNNVMIGANAVVVKDVPDNAVVGGVPAKVISYEGSRDFVHHR